MRIERLGLIAAVGFYVLVQAGCADPAGSICDRAEECGGLSKRTHEQCVADFNADLSESQLDRCASCVDEHSCAQIKDNACNDACAF